mgnify:CR=1 FL=1
MTPFSWITIHVANLLIDVAYDGLEVYNDGLHSRFVAACTISMSVDCPHRVRVIRHYNLTKQDLRSVPVDKTIYCAMPQACALMGVSSEEAREMYLFELAIRNL